MKSNLPPAYTIYQLAHQSQIYTASIDGTQVILHLFQAHLQLLQGSAYRKEDLVGQLYCLIPFILKYSRASLTKIRSYETSNGCTRKKFQKFEFEKWKLTLL